MICDLKNDIIKKMNVINIKEKLSKVEEKNISIDKKSATAENNSERKLKF